MSIFHQPEVTLEISKLSYSEGQRHVINDSAHRTLSPSPDISNPRECWRTLFSTNLHNLFFPF